MTPEHEHELDSEADDEAPEELTFQNARSLAEESARLRREADNRAKAVLKEKRKRKQELFSEQKKKKLLSDDILQAVSTFPDKQPEPSGQCDEPNEKVDNEERRGRKKLSKKLLPRKSLQDNYKVVHLNDQNDVDLQQQQAKNFLHKLLYGKSKNRTTVNEFFSISRKKDVNKRPAVQFTDNSWGEEEKKKAAKFNLLRANRQKL